MRIMSNINYENRDKRWNPVLVNHINELNAETKARGAVGIFDK